MMVLAWERWHIVWYCKALWDGLNMIGSLSSLYDLGTSVVFCDLIAATGFGTEHTGPLQRG